MSKRLMIGNEAVARGLYEAGVTVVSSYPGTPSTEITEFVAKFPEVDAEWAAKTEKDRDFGAEGYTLDSANLAKKAETKTAGKGENA